MFNRKTLNDPRTIALTGVMTAIIFILTRMIQFPTPGGGYIHLGDAGVLFTGFAFGPVVGTIAGALGTALADVTSPYAQWAPFTLIIHGLMGFVAGHVVRENLQIWKPIASNLVTVTANTTYTVTIKQFWRLIAASIIAGFILISGYFVAGLILVGIEAALDIGQNIAQIIGGAVGAVPLY